MLVVHNFFFPSFFFNIFFSLSLVIHMDPRVHCFISFFDSIKKKIFFLKGVWDNVRVKQASLAAAVTIASNLLEVDEVMRAGLRDLKSGGGGQ